MSNTQIKWKFPASSTKNELHPTAATAQQLKTHRFRNRKSTYPNRLSTQIKQQEQRPTGYQRERLYCPRATFAGGKRHDVLEGKRQDQNDALAETEIDQPVAVLWVQVGDQGHATHVTLFSLPNGVCC
jgi:hypothetical protein